MTGRPVVFAGGGTGGHIVPAVAIAQELRARGDRRLVFVAGDKPLDVSMLERLAASGDADETCHIPARPFSTRPRGLARLLASWGVCVRTSRAVLRTLKERAGERPVVAAMGGYVAAPVVQAARAEKCLVLLVNLDVTPGLANRWIAKRAAACVSVARSPDAPRGISWEVVGPIVRPGLREPRDAGEAMHSLGLEPGGPMLLVTGGSQGARTINALMLELLRRHAEVFRARGWRVLHQCGSEDPGILASAYAAERVPAVVTPFIDDMAAAWAAASLSIARAGAGTVAEAWATRTPTVFLPYPYHADRHQRLNAALVCDPGGGVILDDLLEAEATLDRAGDPIGGLLADPGRLEAMRDALAALPPADGAAAIAERLLGI